MTGKSEQQKGAQQHPEGGQGERTHSRFVEQLHEPEERAAPSDGRAVNAGRLHQDRQQHDEAEKNSEKVEAQRKVQRGELDDDVTSHARIPHEGDSN